MVRTECPLDSGPMSRKASVFSLSKIFIEGISPVGWVSGLISRARKPQGARPTLDDLAEDTAGHCGAQRWLVVM